MNSKEIISHIETSIINLISSGFSLREVVYRLLIVRRQFRKALISTHVGMKSYELRLTYINCMEDKIRELLKTKK